MVNSQNIFSDKSKSVRVFVLFSIFSTLFNVSSSSVLAMNLDSVEMTSSNQIYLAKSTSALELLQAGIASYETGDFAGAEKTWLKSIDLFTREKDILGQALAEPISVEFLAIFGSQ